MARRARPAGLSDVTSATQDSRVLQNEEEDVAMARRARAVESTVVAF